jgi:hypothetical protein
MLLNVETTARYVCTSLCIATRTLYVRAADSSKVLTVIVSFLREIHIHTPLLYAGYIVTNM